MSTHMRQEINEIPDAASRLLSNSHDALQAAGQALRERDPAFLITIARGSSDHAAHFLKYAIEQQAGRAVASIGPSLASIYNKSLKLDQAAAISISQSGKSPDIVALAQSAAASGALTLSLTNTQPSPLSDASAHAVDINAGPELAVAATKSFFNSVLAGLAILSEWTVDTELQRSIQQLPEKLKQAVTLDWHELAAELGEADSLYMLGRGPSLAIASEAALKFKETSEMHAEAYSSAEVLHGPVALVDRRFPVVTFAARDAALTSVLATADGLAEKGALAFITADGAAYARRLPFVETGHPLTDSLALIVPFYGFVEAWSRSRGFNPDAPAALKKVTETR
ncbi:MULTISPECIES: SIS domain-containing protein [Agrobacterium]|uniref:Glutamine-fructose-6-phosphate aminotransferase n=1 Tax=Agrobacterium rosae TaxID=1972867 RepID=A0A1R3TLZ4_9HYPH|nr:MULTISPECIES: SIS domain-containing protein [Agrobacterium]SCX10916.1 Glutamine-fructose-6-phosphate aminotransferase [Agrobacterium sp. DSM 25558]SCX23055.1 Glutamine-fructose-6-phosphate aminotransferase [Agrobacterium rosae]